MRKELARLNTSPIVAVHSDQNDPRRPTFTVTRQDGSQQWVAIDPTRQQATAQQRDAEGFREWVMRTDGQGQPTERRHGPDDKTGPSTPPAPGSNYYNPSDPTHSDHALYAVLKQRIPQASGDRLTQFTAACHMAGITERNIYRIYPLEKSEQIWFDSSSLVHSGYAKVDLKASIPTPQELHAQVQGYDQKQEAMQQAQQFDRQARLQQEQGRALG